MSGSLNAVPEPRASVPSPGARVTDPDDNGASGRPLRRRDDGAWELVPFGSLPT